MASRSVQPPERRRPPSTCATPADGAQYDAGRRGRGRLLVRRRGWLGPESCTGDVPDGDAARHRRRPARTDFTVRRARRRRQRDDGDAQLHRDRAVARPRIRARLPGLRRTRSTTAASSARVTRADRVLARRLPRARRAGRRLAEQRDGRLPSPRLRDGWRPAPRQSDAACSSTQESGNYIFTWQTTQLVGRDLPHVRGHAARRQRRAARRQLPFDVLVWRPWRHLVTSRPSRRAAARRRRLLVLDLALELLQRSAQVPAHGRRGDLLGDPAEDARRRPRRRLRRSSTCVWSLGPGAQPPAPALVDAGDRATRRGRSSSSHSTTSTSPPTSAEPTRMSVR